MKGAKGFLHRYVKITFLTLHKFLSARDINNERALYVSISRNHFVSSFSNFVLYLVFDSRARLFCFYVNARNNCLPENRRFDHADKLRRDEKKTSKSKEGARDCAFIAHVSIYESQYAISQVKYS